MTRENETEEMREFIQNLLHTQKTHGLLLCGSTFEMPLLYVLRNLTDVDIMYFPLDACALPVGNTQAPHGFQGKILTIYFDVLHPGFARLCDESHSPIKHWKDGPSSSSAFRVYSNSGGISKLLVQKAKLSRILVDRVYAIYCPCWPAEAAEWISRKRNHGWPSNDIIERIAKRGYHFVAKSPRSISPDYTLWRISFSLAEIILIHTWTDVQKYVYHLLKLIKNEVLKHVRDDCKTVLCTYFLKTLMFWACEQEGPEFWKDENLYNSVACLLCRLTEWLIEKSCRNYFIPNYNMLDGLTDDLDLNLYTIIESLCNYCENGNILKLISTHEEAHPNRKFKISIPNRLLLLWRSIRVREIFDDPFEPNMRNYLVDSLIRENSPFWLNLISLHKAMTIHLWLMSVLRSSHNLADFMSYINLALAYFVHSFISIEAMHCETTICLGESLHEHLSCLGKEMEEVSSDGIRQSINDYSQLNFESSIKRICCYRRREIQADTETQKSSTASQFYELIFQILFDEISIIKRDKPCFLLSAAFLGNYCHTVLNMLDRRLAIAIFENTLTRLQDGSRHAVSDENLYPIAITNKLSSLFDKHFQTVLGFLTFFYWTTGSSERSSVIVRICPAQLVKYLGVQFGRYKAFSNDGDLLDFHCNHVFELSLDLHEPLSVRFMTAVLHLSETSKEPP